MVGGNILFDDGNITAKGGHIEIGSVLGEGRIGFIETDIGFILNYDSINSFGDITIQNTAVVDVTAADEGSINVNGNSFILNNSSLNLGIAIGLGLPDAQAGDTIIKTDNLSLSNSALIRNTTSGMGNAGNVFIEAQEVTLSSSNIITEVSDAGGVGNAGNISITTNSLALQDGSAFLADTENQGNAGNILIEARDSVTLLGIGENTNPSQITSTVDAGSNPDVTGNSGNIEINTGSLFIADGGFISASTFGLGNGGKITINASDLVSLGNEGGNGRLLTNIESGAIGNSGGVEINANSLSVNNFSQIQSQVEGQGNSGKIIINAQDTVSFDGRDTTDTIPSAAFSRVLEGGNGNAGGIEINANSLSLSNRAQLSSTLSGTGKAGDIVIDTDEEVSLSNSIIISEVSDLGGEGDGGDINITTDSLFLRDGSALLADTENQGNAGNIIIEAPERVVLEGEGAGAQSGSLENDFIVSSQISSSVDTGTNPDVMGNAGNIEINTGSLSITNGGFINASTSNLGNAGNINITTPSLEVKDNGFIRNRTFASGNAGNLTIDTRRLNLNEGRIDSSTFGSGEGGNLTITASEIELSGADGNFPTSIFTKAIDGTGNAGDLTITTDKLSIQDLSSVDVGNFVRPFPDSPPPPFETGQGAAGTLKINANSIEVNNGLISADNASGVGGELEVNANSVTLENGASIVAETTANTGTGGVINLSVDDTLQIRDSSFISARATEGATGGNINIDTNFIIAFPDGNNDILANANQGQGGDITINAESLFGIQERLENPQTNDINASSQVMGLDGSVSITTPDINPVQGATELPRNVVEPEQTIVQACKANKTAVAQNSFTIKGKGGIPQLPDSPLNSLNVTVSGESTPTSTIPTPIETSKGKIQPARGVKVTESGEVILTAYRTNNSGERIPETRNCSRV